MKIISTNPSKDNETIWEVEATSPKQIKEIVQNAKGVQADWYAKGLDFRIQVLTQVLEYMKQHKEALALLISQEMGMPITQANDELEYGFGYFKWYLQMALKFLAPEVTKENEKEKHTVFYEPKWVVVAIAPWNYPFSMFVWTSIQALLAWNSVIFKTSKEVILTGQFIEKLFREGWMPNGVWSEVYGDGKSGDVIIENDINFIVFTWSVQVGKMLYKKASEKFIGCVLELWGSAPWIVCQDADIDKVLNSIYFLRFSNCGQMCDGLKRLIVHESRYDEVTQKLSNLLLTKKIGIATETSTDIWPLVNEPQLITIEAQVQDALDKGANILAELTPDDSLQGAYHSAMILWDITKDMKVWQEEVFGPILPIITFKEQEEALELANDTIYWLGSYVFTQSKETLNYFTKNLKTGEVQHNNINFCIPENPFWGVKSSWLWREHWYWGFHEVCDIKVVSEEK